MGEENTTIEEWFDAVDKEIENGDYDVSADIDSEEKQEEPAKENSDSTVLNEEQSQSNEVEGSALSKVDSSLPQTSSSGTGEDVQETAGSSAQQLDEYNTIVLQYLESNNKILTNMQATGLYCLLGLGLIFGGICALIFSRFWRLDK